MKNLIINIEKYISFYHYFKEQFLHFGEVQISESLYYNRVNRNL